MQHNRQPKQIDRQTNTDYCHFVVQSIKKKKKRKKKEVSIQLSSSPVFLLLTWFSAVLLLLFIYFPFCARRKRSGGDGRRRRLFLYLATAVRLYCVLSIASSVLSAFISLQVSSELWPGLQTDRRHKRLNAASQSACWDMHAIMKPLIVATNLLDMNYNKPVDRCERFSFLGYLSETLRFLAKGNNGYCNLYSGWILWGQEGGAHNEFLWCGSVECFEKWRWFFSCRF